MTHSASTASMPRAEKLSESPGVLDLAVDGLDHRLATRVQRSALGSVESPAHPLERVEFIGRVAGARGRSPIAMTDLCGRHPRLGAQRPRARFRPADSSTPYPPSHAQAQPPTLALTRSSMGAKFAASAGWSVTPQATMT